MQFAVSEVFSVMPPVDRVIIVGTVCEGSVRVGDAVEVSTPRGREPATVEGIESLQQPDLREASAGDEVGLRLAGIRPEQAAGATRVAATRTPDPTDPAPVLMPHRAFEALRLAQVVDPAAIVRLDGWSFMGREWVGEAVGMTEWLRDVRTPDCLGCAVLDLTDLSAETAAACLHRLNLPLRAGMTADEVAAALGASASTGDARDGHTTLEYRLVEPGVYDIECTVTPENGLVYVLVMVPDDGDPD